jgi:hypothetical protein
MFQTKVLEHVEEQIKNELFSKWQERKWTTQQNKFCPAVTWIKQKLQFLRTLFLYTAKEVRM